MSRTFRRKNYELTNPNSWGFKTAGYYTEYDYSVVESGYVIRYGVERYRAPTKHEYHKHYWRIHGDSHRNLWSPGKYYRWWREKENRSINNEELFKTISDLENHEGIFEENPRSCHWDWS